jgi:hypothetical protein
MSKGTIDIEYLQNTAQLWHERYLEKEKEYEKLKKKYELLQGKSETNDGPIKNIEKKPKKDESKKTLSPRKCSVCKKSIKDNDHTKCKEKSKQEKKKSQIPFTEMFKFQ